MEGILRVSTGEGENYGLDGKVWEGVDRTGKGFCPESLSVTFTPPSCPRGREDPETKVSRKDLRETEDGNPSPS